MAAVVKSDAGGKPGANVGYSQHIYEKFRKLMALGRKGFGLGFQWCPGKKLEVEYVKHRAARPGGDHNNFRITQLFENFGGGSPRLVPVTGIECRLTATGYVLGTIHLVPKPFEYVHHVHTHLGVHGIHEARDEKRYIHLISEANMQAGVMVQLIPGDSPFENCPRNGAYGLRQEARRVQIPPMFNIAKFTTLLQS